ncbi:MAG TPA: hypothetical protein VJ776_09175 [Thermoanaerobaculia bacterium]|nr:hypothetical protein [Thermoanaerobaculia bacterium]
MNLRQGLAAAASGVLLLLLLWGDDPKELARRARTLAGSVASELAVRRLHGSGTAQDRRFFTFLESVRRRLPAGTVGVVITGLPPSDAALYLAAYQFAPTPVLLDSQSVPPGWLLAVYGTARPAGWKVVAPVWGGALMAPT